MTITTYLQGAIVPVIIVGFIIYGIYLAFPTIILDMFDQINERRDKNRRDRGDADTIKGDSNLEERPKREGEL